MTINPAAFSKINWTQVVGAVAMLASIFGLDVPADQQVAIVGGIGVATQVLTVILRTFFTAKP